MNKLTAINWCKGTDGVYYPEIAGERVTLETSDGLTVKGIDIKNSSDKQPPLDLSKLTLNDGRDFVYSPPIPNRKPDEENLKIKGVHLKGTSRIPTTAADLGSGLTFEELVSTGLMSERDLGNLKSTAQSLSSGVRPSKLVQATTLLTGLETDEEILSLNASCEEMHANMEEMHEGKRGFIKRNVVPRAMHVPETLSLDLVCSGNPEDVIKQLSKQWEKNLPDSLLPGFGKRSEIGESFREYINKMKREQKGYLKAKRSKGARYAKRRFPRGYSYNEIAKEARTLYCSMKDMVSAGKGEIITIDSLGGLK